MVFHFHLLSPWLMSSLYLLKSRRIHSKLLGATIAGVPHQNHGGWWRQGNSSARLKRISIKRYCLYASRILQERFPPTIKLQENDFPPPACYTRGSANDWET